MLVYATLLLILITGLMTSMAMRTPVILDVIRDRNTLYREIPGNMIENIYTLKIINQDERMRSFVLSVEGLDGIVLDGIGETVDLDGSTVLSLPVRARASREEASGINTIRFTVTAIDDGGVSVTEDSRFIGPTP